MVIAQSAMILENMICCCRKVYITDSSWETRLKNLSTDPQSKVILDQISSNAGGVLFY